MNLATEACSPVSSPNEKHEQSRKQKSKIWTSVCPFSFQKNKNTTQWTIVRTQERIDGRKLTKPKLKTHFGIKEILRQWTSWQRQRKHRRATNDKCNYSESRRDPLAENWLTVALKAHESNQWQVEWRRKCSTDRRTLKQEKAKR